MPRSLIATTGHSVPLPPEGGCVGRGPGAEIVIRPELGLLPQHFRISRREGGWQLSTCGEARVLVNGLQVRQATELHDGDLIVAELLTVTYRDVEEAAARISLTTSVAAAVPASRLAPEPVMVASAEVDGGQAAKRMFRVSPTSTALSVPLLAGTLPVQGGRATTGLLGKEPGASTQWPPQEWMTGALTSRPEGEAEEQSPAMAADEVLLTHEAAAVTGPTASEAETTKSQSWVQGMLQKLGVTGKKP